ncbi:MAG TPA: hypothetical protein VGL56_12305 [Fimbriimonadaceae bacterium]|jgi:hypothetical protein
MKFSTFFGKSEKPDHLESISDTDYRRLVALVKSELSNRKVKFVVDEKKGQITFPDLRFEMGLTNLAQMCQQAEKAQWPEMVRHFVAVSEKNWSSDPEAKRIPEFDEVKAQLKVRLNTVEFVTATTLPLLTTFDVSDKFLTYLVIDTPQEVTSVPSKSVEHWGRPLPELFEIALQNCWEQDPVEKGSAPVGNGVEFVTLMGETFFASTHLLMLDKHFPAPPEAGLLVSVPTRHTILACELTNKMAAAAFSPLAFITCNMYEDGPGSVSQDVFWWHNGQLKPLILDIGSNGAKLLGPDEFLEVMQTME